MTGILHAGRCLGMNKTAVAKSDVSIQQVVTYSDGDTGGLCDNGVLAGAVDGFCCWV